MLLGKFGMGSLGTLAVLATIVSSEGYIGVRVVEKQKDGHHIVIYAPGILATTGLRFVPRDRLLEAAEHVRPWMPTIRAAEEELSASPDAVFVEVNDRNEYVRVAKSWGAIVVDVDDAGETVHVRVPLAVMRDAVEQIAAANPAVFEPAGGKGGR